MDEENSDVLVQKKDPPSSSLIQKPVKKRKVGGKLDVEEQEYLDSLLAICIARTTMSVSLVDDENLRKFLKELNPEVIFKFIQCRIYDPQHLMFSIILLVASRFVT